MLDQWLGEKLSTPTHGLFEHVNVFEIAKPSKEIKEMLGDEVLSSFRSFEMLKFHYETRTEQELVDYIKNYVLPDDAERMAKIVWKGDFGEVLASSIVSYFRKLVVPIKKMRWKFNKDKSVFSTDMFAHNDGDVIKDLYYYEVKSRKDTTEKEGAAPDRFYIAVIAHNGLKKEQLQPTEAIADFLSKYYFDRNEFAQATKYHDIILNPTSYKKFFEVFLIIDKAGFNQGIVDELEALPPALKPLCLTIVLIDDLESLVKEIHGIAIKRGVAFVFPKP